MEKIHDIEFKENHSSWRRFLKDRNYTQSDVESLMGYAPGSISKMISSAKKGKRGFPRVLRNTIKMSGNWGQDKEVRNCIEIIDAQRILDNEPFSLGYLFDLVSKLSVWHGPQDRSPVSLGVKQEVMWRILEKEREVGFSTPVSCDVVFSEFKDGSALVCLSSGDHVLSRGDVFCTSDKSIKFYIRFVHDNNVCSCSPISGRLHVDLVPGDKVFLMV